MNETLTIASTRDQIRTIIDSAPDFVAREYFRVLRENQRNVTAAASQPPS